MEQRTLSQLDDLDRAILAAVASARAKNPKRGPIWREIRAELGLPPPPGLPRGIWQRVTAVVAAMPQPVEHPRRLARQLAEAERPPDPMPEFRVRMHRLRDDGFLTFKDDVYRSLNVGERLREMYRQAKAKPR